MSAPLEMLSAEEREVIRRSIEAAFQFFDRDFHTRLGVTQETMRSLLRIWPNVDIQAVALRKLRLLNQARVIGDLRVPPGNQLEALRDDRQGQHSIRINDQWRICFRWREGGASDVEIVDYH